MFEIMQAMSSGVPKSSHCLPVPVVVLLFLALSFVTKWTDAKVIEVGGIAGWKDWDMAEARAPDYNAWAAFQSIVVGDSLVFSFLARWHDVVLFNSEEAYETCNFSLSTLLDAGSSGTYVWHATSPGEFYFGCDKANINDNIVNDCLAGQKVAITVKLNPTGTSSPSSSAPAPSIPPTGTFGSATAPSVPPSGVVSVTPPTTTPAPAPSVRPPSGEIPGPVAPPRYFPPASAPSDIPYASRRVPVAPPTGSPASVPASPASVPTAAPTETPATAPSSPPEPDSAIPEDPPSVTPSTSPTASESRPISPPSPRTTVMSPPPSPYQQWNAAGTPASISWRRIIAVAVVLMAQIT